MKIFNGSNLVFPEEGEVEFVIRTNLPPIIPFPIRYSPNENVCIWRIV